MPRKTLNYRVLKAEPERIDILLTRLLNFSRAQVRGLLDHEELMLNSLSCRDGGTEVKAGDVISCSYDPQRRYREKPLERRSHGFELVYRDEYLVVVNKEAGVLTVPTERGEAKTLIDLLSHFLAAGQYRAPRVSVVHRLDRDTSGLLVFAQNPGIARQLIKQFAARKPEREYRALVAGQLPQDAGEIRSLLHTDKALNQRSGETGELAITHYRVLARYQDATLIAVNLETGRRNQIRVHFAEAGFPILGDVRYESERASHGSWPFKRLALHARVLGFTHPVTQRELKFEAEMPQEFARFCRSQTLDATSPLARQQDAPERRGLDQREVFRETKANFAVEACLSPKKLKVLSSASSQRSH